MTHEELKTILKNHDLWYRSAGAEGERADLSGANLSHADLSGANLSHADLSGAKLSGADLSHADLSHAKLSHADLSHAKLSGANLSGANLDFASWPLWCGSKDVKGDAEQAKQLLMHAFNFAGVHLEGIETLDELKDFINSGVHVANGDFPAI